MAAATPKTPSDAQPTSENITYEATLNAAASASRFPAGAFLDYAGLKKILEALAETVEWGDPRGPAVIGSILIALLSLSLVLNTRRLMAGEI